MMTLYRAMCAEEARDTLRHRAPSFFRRYKFFSPSLQFVRGRVQDGEFNNSRSKPNRYTHLLMFRIPEADTEWFDHGRREWRLDRRCIQNVHWLEISEERT